MQHSNAKLTPAVSFVFVDPDASRKRRPGGPGAAAPAPPAAPAAVHK